MTQFQQLFSAAQPAGPAIIESRDPLVVAARFSTEFAPHQLDVGQGGARPFRTTAHMMEMNSATLFHVASSPDVRITTGPMPDKFVFYVPLQGRIRIGRESGSVEVSPGRIGIVNPSEPYSLSKIGDCTQLTFKLPRAALESHAEILLGHGLVEPLAFDTTAPLPFESCPLFVRMLDMLAADLFALRHSLSDPACSAPAESLMTRLLLRELPNNYSDLLLHHDADPHARPAPYYVRRVEQLIASDARQPLTMEDFVAAAGVSARTLYAGFREHRGVSPMRHLREMRLDGAHAELRTLAKGGTPRRTVTEVALDWGFNHMSDFANAYRRRFGERPSQTLHPQG